jgi:hypothetical protein
MPMAAVMATARERWLSNRGAQHRDRAQGLIFLSGSWLVLRPGGGILYDDV